MNGTTYQELAARTLIAVPDHVLTPEEQMVMWNGLGIAGEAGEVADYIKKVVCHQHQFDRAKFVKELGDVMWYVAALATDYGITLDEVMATNIEKLKVRYPAGYNSADSLVRKDLETS